MFTFKFYYCFQLFPMINIFFNTFYDIHNRKEGLSYHTCQLVFHIFEPKQRAQSPPKVPPAARPPIFMADMAGGLAAGLASEIKTDTIPYGRSFPDACGEELQTFSIFRIMTVEFTS